MKNGQLMGIVTGDIRVLLSGERVALNYLQRMSGIATIHIRGCCCFWKEQEDKASGYQKDNAEYAYF